MAIANPIPERRHPKILQWVMVFCAVGACVNFIGLAIALHQIGGQASEGREARARQLKTYGVSVKVYEDATKRGVITRDDLVCFKTGQLCPPPRRTP